MALDCAADGNAEVRECVAAIAEAFRAYNAEFGRITRRAALNFLAADWSSLHADAVLRIELYDLRVAGCAKQIADRLDSRRTDEPTWIAMKGAYDMLIARRADSDFYRTFFNSVCRDLFDTVGVNQAVEFCSTAVGRAAGAVSLRIYRTAGSLPAAVTEILADLPFGAAIEDQERVVHRVSAEIGRHFEAGRQSSAPESIELIEPVFYRGHHAYVVGRVLGDGFITPLVIAFENGAQGVSISAVMLSGAEVGSLFGYARSYFHVDLPVVSAAITFLRSLMPRKPIDELYTVLGRAKQGKTERYFALQRHLKTSIDSFVHAPGERGLVMVVFTLPSHELVFKVIRDEFGAPKTSSREDVVDRYRFVFRHDRAGRLVDAQEFRRLRLPRARFMPALVEELLTATSQTCRIEGDDLIVDHCYIERRLRPLNLFVREAEPAAAEVAIIDYGNALRDMAACNVFPGDLLLKNFGVTSQRRVIFYDFDELSALTDCVFRDLPQPRFEEEEFSAEPWFHCGPRDVFPEQWLPYLAIPKPLQRVFLEHHAELLTAAWWREQAAMVAESAKPEASVTRHWAPA